ncbi:MAG: hypothetical protein B6242_17505 [Anaerolineaceae bacterium 4572_78]|nr:MAG: hypothetical protein B6242_17505 [Anaerolineaceae bacterium 4572_78]
MKNEKSDFRVVESNFLISGQYKMSLSETKLILCMFQKIDINDKDFQQYKIYLKDFIDLQDKKRKDIYAIADKLTDTFLQHIIRIKEKVDCEATIVFEMIVGT